MNVYDFDGTIYKKDSSIELYKYIIRKKPSIAFKYVPIQILAIIKYKMHLISKDKMKELYFSFLKSVDILSILNNFIEIELVNINEWYLKQKKEEDLIISASPQFLIEAFAIIICIKHVIATEVDFKTGKFKGTNCFGMEKVNRFKEKFPDTKINKFYSDSKSDLYLAEIAEEALFVKKGNIYQWEFDK